MNATAFYMYTHPALDHSWLRNCEGFAALRHSVNDSNTAEVGVHRLLRRHSARVMHASHARLFYVPVFEYTSYTIGECNGTSHRGRMEAARDALQASQAFRRNNGADHFFATSAWSIPGTPDALHARMQPLSTLLMCGIAGRYKAFAPFSSTAASAGGSCTFELPYQANLASERMYRPRTDPRAPVRKTLLHFAGALDVCCTGRQIRCAIAPLYGAAATGALPDAIIRPIIPNSLAGKPCTVRAMKLAEAPAAAGASPSGRSMNRAVASPTGRRLVGTPWRWAVNSSDVDRMAHEMTTSVFCLSPAGDNCVSARFFSAVAAGCLPVVICDHLVGAFADVVSYDAFWIKQKASEFIADPHALVSRLRAISAEEIARRQDAMEQYRADILYSAAAAPARMGSNVLRAAAACVPRLMANEKHTRRCRERLPAATASEMSAASGADRGRGWLGGAAASAADRGNGRLGGGGGGGDGGGGGGRVPALTVDAPLPTSMAELRERAASLEAQIIEARARLVSKASIKETARAAATRHSALVLKS